MTAFELSKKDLRYCKFFEKGLQISMSKSQVIVGQVSPLLNTPLCLLDLQIKGSIAEECIQIVRKELKDKGLKFNFHYWISDDWFCADGIPGIALPFYLFNSKVAKLERETLGTLEGMTKIDCLKLIRHEVGHAIDNAFNLRNCREREALFGKSTQRYPKEYIRKPFSRNYVRHIRENYAQAHPDEDWAETFAVWLNPNSNWKKKYKDWKAIDKLNYLDSVMNTLKGRRAPIANKDTIDDISTIGITLRTYLNRKLKSKTKYNSPLFGRNISGIFRAGTGRNAHTYLTKHEKELCITVAKSTDQYHYIVKDVLKELKTECKNKNLMLKMTNSQTRDALVHLLNKSTLNYLKQGKNKVIM